MTLIILLQMSARPPLMAKACWLDVTWETSGRHVPLDPDDASDVADALKREVT
jgi:hypothetical protein